MMKFSNKIVTITLVAVFVAGLLSASPATTSAVLPPAKNDASLAVKERRSNIKWMQAPTCCINCSYPQSSCCCAPRRTRTVVKKVTKIVTQNKSTTKKVTATRVVSRTTTATATVWVNGTAKHRVKRDEDEVEQANLPVTLEADVQGDIQAETTEDEPAEQAVGEVAEQDESLLPSSAQSTVIENHLVDNLVKRHLCPACPQGVPIFKQKNNGGGSVNYCCAPPPAVKTTTKIIKMTKKGTKTFVSTVSILRTSTFTVTTTTTVSPIQGRAFTDVNGNGVYENPPDQPIANSPLYLVPYANATQPTPTPGVHRRAMCQVITYTETDWQGEFVLGVGVGVIPPRSKVAIVVNEPCGEPITVLTAGSNGELPTTATVAVPATSTTVANRATTTGQAGRATTTAAPVVATTTKAPAVTTTKAAPAGSTTTAAPAVTTSATETGSRTETTSSSLTSETQTTTMSLTKTQTLSSTSQTPTTTATPPAPDDWTTVAMSANGSIVLAGTSQSTATTYYWSTDGGSVWSNCTNATQYNYASASMSKDGSVLTIIGNMVYTSFNYGATWVKAGSNPNTVVVSENGNLLAMTQKNSPYKVATSTNATTWTTQTGAMAGTYLAISSCTPTGSTLLALMEGASSSQVKSRISADSGVTWTAINALTDLWVLNSITCSQDGGTKMVVVGGSVLYSTNSGSTFTTSTDATIASATFNSVRYATGDLSLIVAAAAGSNGGIFTSTTLGATWNKTAAPTKNYRDAAISEDGQIIIGVEDQGNMYRSTDGGQSFSWVPVSV